MSLIIHISEGGNCVMCMAKNPANVLLPVSQISVRTICVFINKKSCPHVWGGVANKVPPPPPHPPCYYTYVPIHMFLYICFDVSI